ncbi:MAG: hypothetical protein JKX84_00770 [Flavobacteriales bacterium]|nr:hypothetical protein [Flavobacteriales bacterium]
MEKQIKKLSEVYGNSRKIPLTYMERKRVDERFVNDLTRDRHIVLHGGSKQGKSCLRKYHVTEKEGVVIQCTRDYSLESLYEQILKNAEIEYKVSSQITTKGTHKITAKVTAEGGVPFIAKAKGEGSYEYENGKGHSTSYKSLDIDPTEPNDLVRVLIGNEFTKFIIIEDFHYLEEDVQRQFAFDLKVFHETSDLIFIIVGVWQESNRLTIFNGDLSGRITNINADDWQELELEQLINSGFPLLNVRFPSDVISTILDMSNENVGLVQELCYRICEKNEVWQTQETLQEIGSKEQVAEAIESIINDLATRYKTFMRKFSEGLSVTEFEMYKWVMYAVVISTTDELRNGIAPNILFAKIKKVHPKQENLQLTHLNQALERVGKVQTKHKLQPFILDFSNDELFVVDANFLVFLESKSNEQLFEIIELEV